MTQSSTKALLKVERNLPQINQTKNFNKKSKIINDLYDVLGKCTSNLTQQDRVDVREVLNITKSLESVMKAEYLLDTQMQVINYDATSGIKFEFD